MPGWRTTSPDLAPRRSKIGGRRSAVAPGQRSFELRRHPEEDVLAPAGSDDLHSDRESAGAVTEREADRRPATNAVSP